MVALLCIFPLSGLSSGKLTSSLSYSITRLVFKEDVICGGSLGDMVVHGEM